MVDLSDRGSEAEEMSCKPLTPERISSNGTNVKTCVDCGTSRTPLWRGGPAGPKSLCNACGIRTRKKRRALLGVAKEDKKVKICSGGNQSSSSNGSTSTSTSTSTSSGGDCTSSKLIEDTVKNKLWAFGRDVGFQRPRSHTTQRKRKKFGEVEQAACLLMALSCGWAYA